MADTTEPRRTGARRRRAARLALVGALGLVVAIVPSVSRSVADAAPVTRSFLAFGSGGWKALDSGADPGPGWRMMSFDPSSWRNVSLPAGNGAGIASVLSTAPITQYLTRTFTASLGSARLVRLTLRRDDGVIVYLNGRPVSRTAMPYGEPTNATQASSPTTGVQYQVDTFWLPREFLRDGTNRISVELHQAAVNDDAYFDLALDGIGDAADTTAPGAPAATVSEVTPTAIRVAWTPPADASGIAAYRIRRGSNTLVIAQTSWGTNYLDQQLGPGSTYSYSVTAIDRAGNESAASVVSATTSLPAGTPVVRLQAAGDIGMGTAAQNMFTAAGNEPADAFIPLGDLSYAAGTEAAWCQMARSRLKYREIEVVGGNHEDDKGSGGHIDRFAACLTERRVSGGTYPTNYYADYGSLARVIVISPSLWVDGRFYDYFPINQERRWLIDTIAAARAQNRWVVVAMHEPCVSVGEKGCEIRSDLMDVLAGADLLLTGHDHIYARTQQFGLQSGCTTFVATWANPRCVTGDGYGGNYKAGRGVVQVVNGVGGESVNALDMSDPLWPYIVIANGKNSWSPATGYLRVAITPTALSADFRATSGRFGDSFTIRR